MWLSPQFLESRDWVLVIFWFSAQSGHQSIYMNKGANIMRMGQRFHPQGPRRISSNTELADNLFASFLLEIFSLLVSRQTITSWDKVEVPWKVPICFSPSQPWIWHHLLSRHVQTVSDSFLIPNRRRKARFPWSQHFCQPQFILVGDSFYPGRCVLLSKFWESLSGLSFSEAPPHPHPAPQHCVSFFKYWLLFYFLSGIILSFRNKI